MNDLMHLAYISRSTIDGGRSGVEAEVRDILNTATTNNADLEITGALLYSGGYFCQVIEGQDEPLTELFETIQMDPRHGDITVLHYEQLPERNFAQWAMAFAGVEQQSRFNIEGIQASTDQLALREAGQHIVATLHDLVIKHQSTLD